MAQELAQELLAELHRRGIKLRLTDGGALDVLAPAGALTPDLQTRLKAARADLVALVAAAAAPDAQAALTAAPGERLEPFPLTDLQHSYLVGRGGAVELGGVSSHYYFEVEREGLDPERLSESWRKVVARHDMLRMTVLPDGRQQVVGELPGHRIAVTDLRGLAADLREKELARTRAEMDHQVLPGAGPLFDVRASVLGEGRVRLHISLDVLMLDGFSLFLIFDQWRRYYEDPDWRPEPLTVSYRDYVLYEEAARSGRGYRDAETYWLDRVESLLPPPALPLAKQPGQVERTRFTRRHARLPRDRWLAVKQEAQRRGLTPSTVLLTAYAEVLRRWAAQPDFTVNLTLFNRPAVHPQINELVGDFTSVTLLEVRANAADTFARKAEAVARQLLGDLDHAAYSGVKVLRERARRLGGGPGAAMPIVFTSALVLGGDQDVAEGIRFFGDEVYAITQTPQVWLDHQVSEERGELVFNWDAVEELFPAGLLDDMFAAYRLVLDRLGSDPGAWERSGALTALPARHSARREPAAENPRHIPQRTLGELVEAQAAARPDAVAVIGHDGELSYRETVAFARRLARRLLELGADRGDLVAVVLDKGKDQVPAVLGVNLSGAAYLPIDPQWPQARRDELLEQGRVRIAVTSRRLRDELDWPESVRVVTFADEDVRGADAGALDRRPAPQDLAYVIFTSGSTGRPKGVMIDNRAAANTIQDINARFGVGPGDRVLALSALSFDLSVYDVFGLLAAGGTVVMPAPESAHDPAHWGELMARHHVTVWNSVPALMQAWVDAAGQAHRGAGDGPRLVLLSGDWIPVSLPDAARALHPNAELVSLGGATEASIWSVCYPIGVVPPEWVRIPYGKPLTNQTLYVLDDRLDERPEWAIGELYIGGAGVATGYWADPERTAERFIVHPATGERLYRTGDLGRYLPSGDIELLGRQDGQIKLNGYRIELGEIEAALRRQPGVGDAVVGADANPATGRRQLVAHIVPAGAAATAHGSGTVSDSGAVVDSNSVLDPNAVQAPESETWRRVADAGEAEVRRCLTELAPDLAAYRAAWHGVEELCVPIMARTLARLGAFQAAGATASAEEIIHAAALKPRYAALVSQWLAILAERGELRAGQRSGEYRCDAPLDADRLDRLIRDGFAALRARHGAPDTDESNRVLIDYAAACAGNQVEMLRGTVSPLELLVGSGDAAVTHALYAGNPVSRLQNRVAARVVRSFVDRCPADRPVRILEVGAGTGATSAEVLRQLPAGRVHYAFTDVSAYFTERARPRLRDYPFVDYGVFDIDREPAGQGYPPGSVDVVIAANVMHDAGDLPASLRNLRGVLAPGGLMVMIEGTRNSLVQTISVGFIEGLGNHQGQRDLPLLDVGQWRDEMSAAGFARFTSVPRAEAAVDVHVQHVLLGAAADEQVRLDVVRLRGALEETLPDYMVPHHYLLVDRLPLNANGKVDRSALPSPWDGATARECVEPRDEDERRLFEIWAEALGRRDFGVQDNFFELGGDSLHAVGILGRLREEFGLGSAADEALELLFDNPTIAALAVELRDESGH